MINLGAFTNYGYLSRFLKILLYLRIYFCHKAACKNKIALMIVRDKV